MRRALAAVLVLACCGVRPVRAEGESARPTALWSEFVPYSEVEADLPALRDRGAALYVAVRADGADYDGFARLYLTARSLGVEVRPWLLLSQSDGYWFNKWNVPASEAYVRTFLAEMRKRGASPSWLVFDIETPEPLVGQMEEDLSVGKMPGLLSLLTRASRDGSIKDAAAAYSSLVASLHEKGIRVEAVTGNYVLNDDKHLRLQSALGLPVSGVPWDEISFMVYRVEFQRSLGSISPALVHKYAKRARKRFGDRAAIDIGEAGHVSYPQPFTGYTDPADLQADADAAASAGIKDIHVYSLDGMKEKGLDYWLDSGEGRKANYRDLKSDVFLTAIDVLRGLLPEGR